MYVNNLPFPETLHQAQKDLYDIKILLLDPMKKKEKNAKQKQIIWQLISGTEHAIGITFGVMAAIDVYNQRYGMAIIYVALLAIAAGAGFNSGNISNIHKTYRQKLRTEIGNIQEKLNISLPEQLHEIAEIARNIKQQH